MLHFGKSRGIMEKEKYILILRRETMKKDKLLAATMASILVTGTALCNSDISKVEAMSFLGNEVTAEDIVKIKEIIERRGLFKPGKEDVSEPDDVFESWRLESGIFDPHRGIYDPRRDFDRVYAVYSAPNFSPWEKDESLQSPDEADPE